MTNEPQIDWPERLREWNTFYPTDITTRALEAYDRMKGELSLSNDLVKGLEGNLKACEDDNERLRQCLRECCGALDRRIDGANFYFYLTTQFPNTDGHIPLIEWREAQHEALTNARTVLSENTEEEKKHE